MYIFSKAVHTTNSQWTPSFDDYQREINTYPPLWKPSGMRQRDFGGFSYFLLFSLILNFLLTFSANIAMIIVFSLYINNELLKRGFP